MPVAPVGPFDGVGVEALGGFGGSERDVDGDRRPPLLDPSIEDAILKFSRKSLEGGVVLARPVFLNAAASRAEEECEAEQPDEDWMNAQIKATRGSVGYPHRVFPD